MRRASILVFALLLALSITAAAFGETAITSVTVTTSSYGSAFNVLTHTVALEAEDGYWLYNAAGEKLTDTPYDSIRRDFSSSCYIVTKNNRKGVIDSEGKIVVPVRYDDVEVVSERWAYGVTLTPTGTDQGDYYFTSGSSKVYYNVETSDIYYRGTMVGTLTRSDFDTGSYSTNAYGDYLQLKDRSGVIHHYSKDFVDSGINETSEYMYTDRKLIHTGTGQIVWTASCTLTPDEVGQAYTTDGGYVIDLQGNKLFPYSYSYIGSFANGMAYFKTNQGGYGLVDIEGNELIPGIYDEIDYSFSDGISSGYVKVVKDGLAGFASLTGKDTSATFLYPSNILSERTPFLYVKGMDGKYLVISAAAGELEQHFDDVSFVGYGCPLFVGKTPDGKVAVYGLKGEVVLESADWRSTSDIGISRDGKFAYSYVRDGRQYVYTLYTIDYSLPGEDAAVQPDEALAQSLPDGHWICPACGEERDTAFCPQDGTQKPVVSTTWICPNCQTELDTPFCPNDGTKRPE